MTIKEFYFAIGGDYDDAVSRLMSEERVLKFTRKFPESVNLDDLKKEIDEKNWPVAFRIIHTLKGASLNMGYTSLSNAAIELTELLRSYSPKEDPLPYYNRVKAKFDEITAAIKQLDD